jgi:hypothetical protein
MGQPLLCLAPSKVSVELLDPLATPGLGLPVIPAPGLCTHYFTHDLARAWLPCAGSVQNYGSCFARSEVI